MGICKLMNFMQKTFPLPISLASFFPSPISSRLYQRPGLFRSYFVRYSATSYLSTRPICGSRRYDIYFASCSRFLAEEKRKGEKCAFFDFAERRRRTTKCLPRKCTWKGLNALPRYRLPCRPRSRRRFLLTLRSRFHCSFRYRPHRGVNLFHVAVSSRVLTSCTVTGCIPPLWNEPRTGLFIVCLPSSKRLSPFVYARWEALKRVLSSTLLALAALLTASTPRRPLPLSLKRAAWNRREITRGAKFLKVSFHAGIEGRRERIELTTGSN